VLSAWPGHILLAKMLPCRFVRAVHHNLLTTWDTSGGHLRACNLLRIVDFSL